MKNETKFTVKILYIYCSETSLKKQEKRYTIGHRSKDLSFNNFIYLIKTKTNLGECYMLNEKNKNNNNNIMVYVST